jgi:hypothetical protein
MSVWTSRKKEIEYVMKTKLYPCLVAAGAVSLLALGTSIAKQSSKPPKQNGTDILHWAVSEKMLNESGPSNASASVSAKLNQQGNAYNQRLDVSVRNLETNTAYQVWAALDDDTNFVPVADFTTDESGGAKLKFMRVGSSQGKGHGSGKLPLPAELDPISDIRELAIGNVNTQVVFSADLASPDKLQYLVKRTFTEGDVTANLRLKATTKKVQFLLYVWGLQPGTNYSLAVNDAPVAGGTSGTNGNLSFGNLPVAPSDILDVHKLAVWDSVSNSVISTELPQ